MFVIIAENYNILVIISSCKDKCVDYFIELDAKLLNLDTMFMTRSDLYFLRMSQKSEVLPSVEEKN